MPDLSVDPADVRRCLRGLSFPCTREEVVRYALDHDCLPQVVDLLMSLPDERLNSMADVIENMRELG